MRKNAKNKPEKKYSLLEMQCYCLCLLLTGIYDDDQEIVTLSRTDFGKYVIKLSESE